MLPLVGVCVFDIDGTLTEPGSFEAINVCKQLGYGIGINTGENRDSAQVSMNAIYNGVSERGKNLEALHPDLGIATMILCMLLIILTTNLLI